MKFTPDQICFLTEHISADECRQMVAELIWYFRTTGHMFGFEGDEADWTASETAIDIMERYRNRDVIGLSK